MVTKPEIAKKSSLFKVLSDPTRLQIIHLLMANKEGLCVNQIADYAGISQSAASHQLAKLEDKGMVKCARIGQSICYELTDNSSVKKIIKLIK